MPPDTKKTPMPPSTKTFAPTPANLGSILVANGYTPGYPGMMMSQRKVNYTVAKGFRLWGCIAFFLLMIGILVLITPSDKDTDDEDFGLETPKEFKSLDRDIAERIAKRSKPEVKVKKIIEEPIELDEPESEETPEDFHTDDHKETEEEQKSLEVEEVEKDEEEEDLTTVEIGETLEEKEIEEEMKPTEKAQSTPTEPREPTTVEKVRSFRHKGVVMLPTTRQFDSEKSEEKTEETPEPTATQPEAVEKPVKQRKSTVEETAKSKTTESPKAVQKSVKRQKSKLQSDTEEKTVETAKPTKSVQKTKLQLVRIGKTTAADMSSTRKSLVIVVDPMPFLLLKVGSTLFSTLAEAIHYGREKIGVVVERHHQDFKPKTLEIRYFHNKRESAGDVQQSSLQGKPKTKAAAKPLVVKQSTTVEQPVEEIVKQLELPKVKAAAKAIVKPIESEKKPIAKRQIDDDSNKSEEKLIDQHRYEVTPLPELGVIHVQRRSDVEFQQYLKEKSTKTIVSTSEIIRRGQHRKGHQDVVVETKSVESQSRPAHSTVVEISYTRKKGSILASGHPSKPSKQLKPVAKADESTKEIPSKTQSSTSSSTITQVPKYRKAKITNKSDFKIRFELDEAESLATKFNYEAALEAFSKILRDTPYSPRANYGRARTLELIAERQHSSGFLKKAVQAYEEVLRLPTVPRELRTKTIRRLIEDCRFSGRFLKAVELHRHQLEMFPDDIDNLNELGLTFLMMGRYEDAKNIFTDVLHKDPDNVTAHAYYGLILKTVDKDLKSAIDHLRKAISADQWLIDDRFSQHLVDAIRQQQSTDSKKQR